jgi:hypothetical protein
MVAHLRQEGFRGILERYCIGVGVPEGFSDSAAELSRIADEHGEGVIDIPDDMSPENFAKVASEDVDELRASYYTENVRTLLATCEVSSDGEEISDGEPDRAVATGETHVSADDLSALVQKGLPGEREFGIAAAFPGPIDFQSQRRLMAIRYANIAQEHGLSEFGLTPVGVCCVQTCLSSSVPGSQYCFVHYGLDPNFSKQKLFGRCQHVADGQRCCVPCDPKLQYCTLHDWLHDIPSGEG